MSDEKCPKDEKCDIVPVETEKSSSPDSLNKIEVTTPRYKCKTCGKYFYEWELQ